MEQTLHNAFKRFSLGDELRAYTFLGCHAAERDGVHGYVFRVWAPRAQGVSVTGDWNFWNTINPIPMPSATVRCPTRRAVSVRWTAIPGAMPTTAASRASVSCSTAR